MAAFSLEQWLGAGGLALLGGIVTAILARSQAIKVQERQSHAQLGVKRLENDGAVHGYMHEDLVEARKELRDLRAEWMECVTGKAAAESEVKRLTECLEECRLETASMEGEKAELQDRVNLQDVQIRQLETKLAGFQWLEDGIDLPALERLVEQRRREEPRQSE